MLSLYARTRRKTVGIQATESFARNGVSDSDLGAVKSNGAIGQGEPMWAQTDNSVNL